MRTPALVAVAFFALGLAALARDLPAGFVYLREVAPSITQEIRYATFDNFTGRPLPGYKAGECVLRREAAQALAGVEADLAKQNLGLKVYDCYRPTRAVQAMWNWAHEGNGGAKRFYPHVPKLELFSLGYIATHSRHSTGNAVDLTLIKLPPEKARPFERAERYGPCTAPAAERAPDNSIDMGTGFDCLDEKSATHSGAIAAEQRRWRLTLNAAMRKHGFYNYPREWWHYSYGPRDAPAYDFPIEGRKAD
jgi:zinc D-Ala-D-Ala dipeptidase